MEFTSVPIIVLCCYVLAEIYKAVFRNKQEMYRFIPIATAVVGGIIAVAIFYTAPQMIFDADNVWTALGFGIVSGASATGAHQIVKQVFNNKDDE